MSFPTAPLAVPVVVRRIAAGRSVTPVWVNELGGVTFQVGQGASREFVKSPAINAVGEAARLRWAGQFTAVPRVLDVADDWLHTAGLPGESAVDPPWRARPDVAARAIGAGLRALHYQLPVDDCPFDWSVDSRLAMLPAEHRGRLGEPPPIDTLVVCHGDACAPNTLIDDTGRCCGHVDLGELGVADRWADLAVATLSLTWNYPGQSWEGEFFTAYGVEPDPRRIDYYRRLWNAEEPSSR